MRFNPFVPHGPEPFTPIPRSGGPVPSVIEFFKRKIDELFKRDSASVHYTPEEKTDEEKAIARDNIRAQEKLVSGVNLKTVCGQSLLGSGDVPQVPAEWGGIMGNLGMQTDLAEALGGKADRSDVYTKSETDAKITANVEDSVTSTSTTKALSANMGKELQDQIQNLKHSKADEAKPSFSTITINGVDYTEWTLGTRSGKIMLSVDMGGISTEIAAFNPVTGVFVSALSQYRDTLRFDGEAPIVGASPTLFDHVARESALSGKANISHTHTKSEITDFPTSMPPTAHSHASDSWFTTALEAVKVWVKALLPSWLTPDYVEPATVASVETKVNRSGDTMTGKLIVSAGTDSDTGFRAQLNNSNWAELKASKIHVKRGANAATRVLSFPDTSGTFALTSDIADPVEVIDPASATEAGKAADALATKNALDGMITADYVTDFVQQSAILQARIKSVAQSLIRTAFANFDPNEQSFADLVNILKNIGA